MLTRRGRSAAAIAVVAVSLVALTGCASGAASRTPSDSSAAVGSPIPTERDGDSDDTTSKAFLAQNDRQEVLERFDSWVRAQPGVHRHGYIASVDDVANTSVTLLWFGDDPWRDRLVTAGLRMGVTVHFQQRAQSLAAFTASQQRLLAAGARFRAVGFTISTVSGIGAEPQELTIEGAFAKNADRAAVRRLATSIAGQPVLVKSGGGSAF